MKFDDMRPFIEKPFDFIERMGLKAVVLEPRNIRLMVPLAPNVNHIGSMYAGALFTVAEIPGGALFLTTFDVTRFYPVVKEMAIRFKKPATTDVFIDAALTEEEALRIASEAETFGKSEFVLEGEIKDAQGEIVATSRGVYQLRKHV